VPVNSATDLDLSRTRSIGAIFRDAFWLYRRAPLLFILISATVVVPYQVVIVLIVRGKASVPASTTVLLLLIGVALINPFVATFQVQALLTLGDGRRPDFRDVLRRGLAVLPVVAAAAIVAGLGIALGIVCFIVPGVLLAIRWAVVSQTAAVEQTNWPTALRRSAELSRWNSWRILGLLLTVGLLSEIPADVTGTGSHLARAIIGIAIAVIVNSFATLSSCLLYFDLRAREAGQSA
jgi:hypothetical protein